MRQIIISLSAALALCACAGTLEPGPVAPASGEVAVNLRLCGSTRSSLTVPDDAISSVELYFYENGALVPGLSVSRTGSGLESVEVALGIGRTYQILALANCTASPVPATWEEAGELCYRCNGFSDWAGGIPMAGTALLNVEYDTRQASIVVTRLAAKLSLGIDASRLRHGTVRFTSAKVRQMNKVCPFFGRGVATAAGGVCDGDIASAADLEAMNASAGQYTASFYLLENMQGNLLPQNTDPDLKVPDSVLAAGGNPGLCTYLEIEGVYTDHSGFLTGEPLIARLFLGGDATCNFDLSRNCRYSITLQITDEGCLRSDWKVDSTLEDNRILSFPNRIVSVTAPESLFVPLNTNLSLAAGDYSYSMSGSVSAFTFTPGQNGFTIKPQEDILTNNIVTVTATTWDGAITTSCRVTGRPDPARFIEYDWCGDLYVAQKKVLKLRDKQGGSLADRIVVLPNSPCVRVEGSGDTWYVSGWYPGYDSMDLLLDGSLVTHIEVNVLPVSIGYPSDRIVLPMDGTPVEAGPFFYDVNGNRMYYSEFDPGLYSQRLDYYVTRYCMGTYAGAGWTRSATDGNVAVEARNVGSGYTSWQYRLVKLSDKGYTVGQNYNLGNGAVPIERLTADISESITGAGSATTELCISEPFASSRHIGSGVSRSTHDETVTFSPGVQLIVDGSAASSASGRASSNPDYYRIRFPDRETVSVTILYDTYGSAAAPPSSFTFTPVLTNAVSGETYSSLYTYSTAFSVL